MRVSFLVTQDWRSASLPSPTVLAYALTALAASILHQSGGPVLWLIDHQGTAYFLAWNSASLCVSCSEKQQLDLQSFITATGRCIAQLDGWYANRREVQGYFIISLIALSVAGALALASWMRSIFLENWLAFLGLFVTVTFILVRAVGFHHFDQFLDARLNEVRVNWVLELSGIFMVLLASLILLGRRSR